METFHRIVIDLIKKIPPGRVSTYGRIAALAGNPRAARQVVRALHSSSAKEELPWHRVVDARGRIALPPGAGAELQRAMLEREGIVFGADGGIDLDRYLWKPRGASGA